MKILWPNTALELTGGVLAVWSFDSNSMVLIFRARSSAFIR